MAKKKKSKNGTGRRQCEGTTRAGVRCARMSEPGQRRCFSHIVPRSERSGRPKIEWTQAQWKAFESMCILTDKRNRVAVAMGFAEQTINRLVKARYGVSFLEYINKRFNEGNFRLLAKQYEMAVGTDPIVQDGQVILKGRGPNKTMLIWLGKQRLQQTNLPDLDGGDPVASGEFVVTLKPKGD